MVGNSEAMLEVLVDALIGEWPTTPLAPPLTLSAPLCYVEAFLIEERKPPVAEP
jgi:hypothetical protein